MQAARTRTSPRGGFTLIELLVVIAIIAILSSFILAAVGNMRGWFPRVATRSEITNIEGGMAKFKQEFSVDYLPSRIVLRENQYDTNDPDDRKAVGILTRLFGRHIFRSSGTPNIVLCGPASAGGIDWNGNGTIDTYRAVLTGEQCLVFFLGGIPSTATGTNQCLGFSANTENPAAGGARRGGGPFYSFKPARLVDGGTTVPALGANGFFVYRDPYERQNGTFTYYAYFAANASGTYDAYSIVANYYRSGPGGTGEAVNPKGYQILCAGADGVFGSTPALPASWNSGGPSVDTGKDDQANFASGLLGAGSN